MNDLKKKYDLNDPEIVSVMDEVPLWSAPFGMALLEKIKFKPGAVVLDIGCGTGFPLLEIAQRLGSKSVVYGIDPWTLALDRIRHKLRVTGTENVRLVEGIAEELPFADNYFDLIISNNGLNNCKDQERVLSECYRTAKPGCQMVFTQNLPESMIEFYDVFRSLLIKTGNSHKVETLEKHIASKRKTVAERLDLLEKAGFRANEVSESSFSYRFIDGTAMLDYFFIRLAFLPSWVEIVEDIDADGFFNELETELNKVALSQGELRLTVPFAVFSSSKL
jgi:ubiquinone/menaquinone biosynthesis C-methylase UbiE